MNDQTPLRPASPSVGRIEQWVTLAGLAVLIAGCYLVLQPFLTAIIWAVVLCCTTWPTFMRPEEGVGGRIIVPAFVLPVAVAMVLLASFFIVGGSLAQNANELLAGGKRFINEGPPDPP